MASDQYERRSLAARRGWETRRRRAAEQAELARRRSLAAKRGWQTRRAKRDRDRDLFDAQAAAFDRETDFAPDDVVDDLADEWEIGFEYRGAGYGGRHHAVDVNVRVRRDDGRPFGAREAAAVLKAFHAGLSRVDRYPIPAGYQLAAIDWQRPSAGTGWRGGDDDPGPLVDFNAPMYVERDNPLAWSLTPGHVRLGGVKG